MEVLLGTPLVQDYIREGEVHKLKDVMKESTNLGMRTFDQSLFELYQAGEISYEDALRSTPTRRTKSACKHQARAGRRRAHAVAGSGRRRIDEE